MHTLDKLQRPMNSIKHKESVADAKINTDCLRLRLKEKDGEIEALRISNTELHAQLEALHDILQGKEKEIHKHIFEKETRHKSEEEFKKLLIEFKIKDDISTKEIQQLKKSFRKVESDKKKLADSLAEANVLIDQLQTNLRSKEDKIANICKSQKKLELELDILSSPKFKVEPARIDFNRLKIPERLGTSSSPDPCEYNFTDRGEDLSYKAVCQDLMRIVGASSTKDFQSKILHLKQHHSKYKKAKKLIDRISEMIVQCSPEGLFKNEPTTRQIWRWITKLLEEYMKIKQSITGEAFFRLCEMLDANSPEDLVKKVSELKR